MVKPVQLNDLPGALHLQILSTLGHAEQKTIRVVSKYWLNKTETHFENLVKRDYKNTQLLRDDKSWFVFYHYLGNAYGSKLFEDKIANGSIKVGHALYCSALDANGLLFSGSKDAVVQTNLQNNISNRFQINSGVIRTIQVQGDSIWIGSEAGDIYKLNAQTGEYLHSLTGHTDEVCCSCVSSEGLFTGSRDQTVRQWNPLTHLPIRIFKGHHRTVYALATFETWLFSGDGDGKIYCWDLLSGQVKKILGGHNGAVFCLMVDEEGFLYSGSSDSSIKIWDLKDFSLVKELRIRGQVMSYWKLVKIKGRFLVASVSISNGKHYSHQGQYGITIWDLEKPKLNSRFLGEYTSPMYGLCLDGSGNLISGTEDGRVIRWFLPENLFQK